MTPSRFPLLSILLAIIVALPMAAYAGGKHGKGKGKGKEQHKYVPVHRVIKSLTETSITVGDNKQVLTYAITPKTIVEIKGNRATIRDLQVGMKVSIATGHEFNVAERIQASDIPKPAAAPKKKHK